MYKCVRVFDTMTGLLSVVVNKRKNQEDDNLKFLRFFCVYIVWNKVKWYLDNAMNITHNRCTTEWDWA